MSMRNSVTSYYLFFRHHLCHRRDRRTVRRNALIIFMCVEMMLNAVNLSLIALSFQFGQLTGQIFVFFVMAVAAAEVAVGLAIVMAQVRHRDTTNVDDINLLQG